MVRYHIRRDGTPGVCKARTGKCPLSTVGQHFDATTANRISEMVCSANASYDRLSHDGDSDAVAVSKSLVDSGAFTMLSHNPLLVYMNDSSIVAIADVVSSSIGYQTGGE